MADNDTNPNAALDDASHPDHTAAVQRHINSFREPADRVAPAPSPAPAPSDLARRYAHTRPGSAAGSPGAVGADGLPASMDHPYWVKDAPGHAAAVVEVTKRQQAKYNPPQVPVPDPATGAGADAANANAQKITAEANLPQRDKFDLADIRERAGTTPLPLASGIQERWDVQAEGDVLEYASRERIPGQVMQSVLEFYAETFLLRGLDGAEDSFRSRFAGHLTPKQIDTLVKWGRAYHGLK